MGSHSLALLATVSGDSATGNIFPAIAEPIVFQFAGHGRRDSRNWFISFIWSVWFGETRTGLPGLFGLSRSFGWLIRNPKKPNQPNKLNEPERPAGFALSSPRSFAWTERGSGSRRSNKEKENRHREPPTSGTTSGLSLLPAWSSPEGG
jgi:hypothetical protein